MSPRGARPGGPRPCFENRCVVCHGCYDAPWDRRAEREGMAREGLLLRARRRRPDQCARALQRIAAVKGPWVKLLPEVSLLRVHVGEAGSQDLVYALVHNDAHTNIAFMFDELRALVTDADFERFVDRHGIRRTDARFWATSDWLRDDLRRQSPTQAGLYDLGRYGNF